MNIHIFSQNYKNKYHIFRNDSVQLHFMYVFIPETIIKPNVFTDSNFFLIKH